MLNDLARQAILYYDDPLKVFLECSLNYIDYFMKFPKTVKNEWIYQMKHRNYEAGKFLCKKDDRSKEMYIIQSGQVDIVAKMTNGKEFIVEKLYRGSIINHNSFLMDDAIDTNTVCRTAVSLYTIDIATIEKLRAKYVKCEKVLHEHEMKLVNPRAVEPALDYILKDSINQKYYNKDRATT